MQKIPAALLYTSNTGFTRQYAQLLARRTGIPAYNAADRRDLPAAGSAVLYLGWLCAGGIKGLKAARKKYGVRAVCAVGSAPAEEGYAQKLAEQNKLGDIPLFYLRGGYAPQKLKGLYRLMMVPVGKAVSKGAATDPNAAEMARLLTLGGNFVSAEALEPVERWLEARE